MYLILQTYNEPVEQPAANAWAILGRLHGPEGKRAPIKIRRQIIQRVAGPITVSVGPVLKQLLGQRPKQWTRRWTGPEYA